MSAVAGIVKESGYVIRIDLQLAGFCFDRCKYVNDCLQIRDRFANANAEANTVASETFVCFSND